MLVSSCVAAVAVAVAVADAVAVAVTVAVAAPLQAARFHYCPLPRFSDGQHCQYDCHDHDLQ